MDKGGHGSATIYNAITLTCPTNPILPPITQNAGNSVLTFPQTITTCNHVQYINQKKDVFIIVFALKAYKVTNYMYSFTDFGMSVRSSPGKERRLTFTNSVVCK